MRAGGVRGELRKKVPTHVRPVEFSNRAFHQHGFGKKVLVTTWSFVGIDIFWLAVEKNVKGG